MSRKRYLVVAVAAAAAAAGLGLVGPAQASVVGPTVTGTATCLAGGAVQFDSHIEGAAIDSSSSLTSPQGTFLADGQRPTTKFYAEPIDVTWIADDVATSSATITVTLNQAANPSSLPYTFANPCTGATQPATGPTISVNGTSCPDGVTTLDLHVSGVTNGNEFYELTSPQGTYVYQDSEGDRSLRITRSETDIVWESTDTSPLNPSIAVTLTPRGVTPSSNTLVIDNPCVADTVPTPEAEITSATANCANGVVQSFTVAGTGFTPGRSTKIGFYQVVDGQEYGPDELNVVDAGLDGSVTGTTNPVASDELASLASATVTVFLDQNNVANGSAPSAEEDLTFDCSVSSGGGSPQPGTGGGAPQPGAGGNPSAAPVAGAPVSGTAARPVAASPAALAVTGSPISELTLVGSVALLAGAGAIASTRRSRRG